MRFLDLINIKAQGGVLSDEQIEFMVRAFIEGIIPDYQMASMLMAIMQRGMTTKETTALTLSMMKSGEVVDLSDLPGVKVDKHSTGGVGDTTTLVVAPLVAACGGTVAKMSGRGLGHTGGTLDKLESIPGCKVEQPMNVFRRIIRENGVAVVGQTNNLVPADKKLYALRDVTGTVRSIPLIVSSIMSKKLASGANAIVLDVKTGTGAFMQTLEESRELAKQMVAVGSLLGRRVTAVITDMNQPLGMAVGNALEIREAVQLLSGMISISDPLYKVCMLLGTHMLRICGLADSESDAETKLCNALKSGAGLAKLQHMVELLGGDSSYLTIERINELCEVRKKIVVPAMSSGYVCKMNTEMIGNAAQMLGAGRARKEDKIDPAVGLVMQVRIGSAVKTGDPLCVLYVNDSTNLAVVQDLIYEGISISKNPVHTPPIAYDVIEAESV